MKPLTIRKEVEIAAEPERVWQFVGTQDGLQKWWLPNQVLLEERLGGRYEERGVGGSGRAFRLSGTVVAYDPPRRLELSCRGEQGGVSWPAETRITVALEAIPRGTRVTVTHSGFDALPAEYAEEARRGFEAGWQRVMERLPRIAPPLEAEVTQRLPASPRAAFRALIDPAVLAQWFCDVAEVDPRPGGVYAFGGPHAYGGPDVARGRIEQIDPNRILTFTWPMAGHETMVQLACREIAARETDLAVRHSGVLALPVEWASPEHLTAVWQVLLRQLEAHLRGRPLPRFDFAAVPPPVVDQALAIDAPPAAVWEMLTVPSQLNRWISRDAHVELTVGGRYSYGWDENAPHGYGPLRIVALEPPRRLVVSWREAGAVGTVTWTLEPLEGGRATHLRLVHEGLGVIPGILRDYTVGWWEFLIRLPALAAA